MDLIERNKQFLAEQFDSAVSAFNEPEKFEKEWVRNLYQTLISECRKSIQFYQEQLVHLSRMRDKHLSDLETGELIWNNINLINEIIKDEMQSIAEYREVVKHGNR